MTRSSRKRVALVGGLLLLLIVLAIGWFSRRQPAVALTPGSAGSAVVATAPATAVTDRQRLDKIERAARGLDVTLPSLTLAGKVVDGDSKPVAGAMVVLAAQHRVKVSDADGAFAFDGLPPGRYVVEAHAGSRVGGPQLAHLAPGSSPIVVRVYRALTAEIVVVSAVDGKPIDGADVWMRTASMYEPSGNHAGRTGADGKVAFPGVQIAGHDLIVSARGYAGALLGPEVSGRAGDFWRLRVELSPGDGVDGVVVDEHGKPIAGAMLEALPYAFDNASSPEDTATTAAEAGIMDPHVIARRRIGPTSGPDGTFWLSFPKEERTTWVVVASHSQFESMASDPIFTTPKTHQAHKLTMVMHGGARAAGWVVVGDDQPVPGATIQIRWQATSGAYTEKTIQADGRGHFETTGVPRAPMMLLAFGDTATGPPLRVDFSQPSPEHEQLIIALENTGIIRGTVVDPRGKPQPDIVITYGELGHDDEHIHVLPGVENTGEDGRFEIRGVMVGATYHVSAVRPQDGELVVHEGWIDAIAGDDLRIAIPDGGSIVGRVVIDGGRSPAGVKVMDPESLISMTVSATGRFHFANLPPTLYAFVLSGPGVANTYLKGVQVHEGKETDLGDVQLGAGRAISGIVTAAKGDPVPAVVRVVVDDKYRLQVVANPDGHFKITAPVSSSLVVSAANGNLGESRATAIAPNVAADGLRLALEIGGAIHGTAMAKGAPMVNYVVAAFRAGPRAAEPAGYAQVDAAGGYQMEHLVPGAYDVELIFPSANATDVRIYRTSVTVETGAVAEAAFDGTPGPAAGIKQPDSAEREIPTYEVANEAH